MDEISNKRILTPKDRKSTTIATSTVDRSKSQRRRTVTDSTSHLESSLGILSFNNVDLSNIVDISTASTTTGSINEVLKQQRQLANNSLNRASRVSGIPSRLLRPELIQSNSDDDLYLPSQSTVSESDLVQTPKNTSTPRSSASDIDLMRLSLSNPRESIFSRFRDMLDTNISTQDAVDEFKQIVQANKSASINSAMFVPAEEAGPKLMADELSWKQKYDDIPGAAADVQSINSFRDARDLPFMSIGEFFEQRANSISVMRAKSPDKAEPMALIDSSTVLSINEKENECSTTNQSGDVRSLGISAIQKLLVDDEDTPNKVTDYLLQYNSRKADGCRRKSSIPIAQQQQQQRESSDVFSVPVSRDASYTSSFSDNEAVRVAVNEDKENVNPFTTGTRTATKDIVAQPITPQTDSRPGSSDQKYFSPPSSRSSSALTSLPNGMLPIESTVGDLVWGCVKIDRCMTKQFMLRNKTPKTLRLQCSVSTYQFKIRKDNRTDSESLSACRFALHGHESRPIIISFIPTKMGPAVDELVFAPLDANLAQTKKQCIRLWGYGGYSNSEYQNASRDNTGKYWLSLGRMDNRVQMEQTFTIKSTGNLPSFTCIKVVPKHIVTFSNLKVKPNLFVLLPNEEKHVKVLYTPNAKDCRILKQNLDVLPVLDIGKLEIVSGPEVSRARLRRLNRKSLEKGLTVDTLTKILSEKIGGEAFPSSEISRFKESPSAIPEILETLTNEEVIVTIERDPNQTLVSEYPEEDSVIYHTVRETTMIALEETAVSSSSKKSCRLEPPSVVLFPPAKPEDCLFLTSEATKTLHYEVKSVPNDLQISPTDGAITPGETAEFKIKLPRNSTETHFRVLVYVENDEVFESEVKVLRSSRRHFLD